MGLPDQEVEMLALATLTVPARPEFLDRPFLAFQDAAQAARSKAVQLLAQCEDDLSICKGFLAALKGPISALEAALKDLPEVEANSQQIDWLKRQLARGEGLRKEVNVRKKAIIGRQMVLTVQTQFLPGCQPTHERWDREVANFLSGGMLFDLETRLGNAGYRVADLPTAKVEQDGLLKELEDPLRGDPYLWEIMNSYFGTLQRLPKAQFCLGQLILAGFVVFVDDAGGGYLEYRLKSQD